MRTLCTHATHGYAFCVRGQWGGQAACGRPPRPHNQTLPEVLTRQAKASSEMVISPWPFRASR